MMSSGKGEAAQREGAAALPTARVRSRLVAVAHAMWRARPGAHAAALAVVLLGLLPVAGLDAEFSSDESVAIVQARSLARDGTWYVQHPFPGGDPRSEAFPLPRAAHTEHGWAPQPKHPAYSLLLAAADEAGGVAGLVVLSVLGTVAAAWAGALLAGRMSEALVRPAIWTIGAGSPLFVDSYLVIAHTLAAAACACGVLLALRALEGGSRRALAGAAAALAAGALLRSEAVLLGVAFAVVLGVIGLVRSRRRAVVVAGAALVAVVLAYAAEGLVEQRIFGSPRGLALSSAAAVPADEGFVADRLRGLSMTWLRPSYLPANLGAVLSLSAVLTGAAAAMAARRRVVDGSQVALLAGVTSVLVLSRLVAPAASPDVVPGLLVAFPLLVWGLLLVREGMLRAGEAPILLGTAGLFAIAVLATQYPEGGAWEWGGRYFAVGVPLVVPVLLAALRDAGARLGGPASRAALAGLVVAAATLSAVGLGAVHDTRAANEELSGSVRAVAAATDPGDGGTPVIVTTELGLSRVSWRWSGGARWLYAEADGVATVLLGVGRAGVDRAVVATMQAAAAARAVDEAGWRVSAGAPEPVEEAWWVVVVERT